MVSWWKAIGRLLAVSVAVSCVIPTVAASAATSHDPLRGDRFWVNPNNASAAALRSGGAGGYAAALKKIAIREQGVWIGTWDGTGDATERLVAADEKAARRVGAVPVFVLYAIPHLDCSAGSGYPTGRGYESFVNQVRAGIAGRKAVVIVEPDALAQTGCLPAGELSQRLGLLRYASLRLSRPGTSVYLDAGQWLPGASIAHLLVEAGVKHDAGFSLDVSNYQTTASMERYGSGVIAYLTRDGAPGRHMVIDTSRNGAGMAGNPAGSWCNLPGARLGRTPSASTGDRLVDAFLWIKVPGESDGNCSGGPPAGVYWPAYAAGLAAGGAP